MKRVGADYRIAVVALVMGASCAPLIGVTGDWGQDYSGAGGGAPTGSSTGGMATVSDTGSSSSGGLMLTPCQQKCFDDHVTGRTALEQASVQQCGCATNAPCSNDCQTDPSCAQGVNKLPLAGTPCDHCMTIELSKASPSMCVVNAVLSSACQGVDDCKAFVSCILQCNGGTTSTTTTTTTTASSTATTTSAATSSSSGTGSCTMPPNCSKCSAYLNGASPPPGDVCCGNSATLLQDFGTCLCVGTCKSSCEATACVGMTPSNACGSCVSTPDPSGCLNEFTACQSDN